MEPHNGNTAGTACDSHTSKERGKKLNLSLKPMDDVSVVIIVRVSVHM